MHERGEVRINDDPETIWTILFKIVGSVKETGQTTLGRELGEVQEEVAKDDDKRYTYVP